MLTKLEVIHPRASVVPFIFDMATFRTDPLQIHNIEGLGPVGASIASSLYSNFDGEQVTGCSVGKRNIVITFGTNPDYANNQTVADIRQLSYMYFMPKQRLTLKLYLSKVAYPCVISGIVETVEPTLFTDDPSLTVSILCEMPYFEEDHDYVVTNVACAMDEQTLHLIDYNGTVANGFDCEVKVTAGTSSGTNNRELEVITRAYDPADQYETFHADNLTLTGTTFPILDTRDGQKNLWQSASAVNTPNLAKMSADSIWPRLYPGDDNYLLVRTDIDSSTTVTWTLTYRNLYGGF